MSTEKQATRVPGVSARGNKIEELFRLEDEVSKLRAELVRELVDTPYVTVAWGRIRRDLDRGMLKF